MQNGRALPPSTCHSLPVLVHEDQKNIHQTSYLVSIRSLSILLHFTYYVLKVIESSKQIITGQVQLEKGQFIHVK